MLRGQLKYTCDFDLLRYNEMTIRQYVRFWMFFETSKTGRKSKYLCLKTIEGIWRALKFIWNILGFNSAAGFDWFGGGKDLSTLGSDGSAKRGLCENIKSAFVDQLQLNTNVFTKVITSATSITSIATTLLYIQNCYIKKVTV